MALGEERRPRMSGSYIRHRSLLSIFKDFILEVCIGQMATNRDFMIGLASGI